TFFQALFCMENIFDASQRGDARMMTKKRHDLSVNSGSPEQVEGSPDLTGWKDAVYLASLVMHEFKNDLNNLLLYLAVLEQQQAEGEGASKLAAFRQMALKTAAMVENFQRFSHAIQPSGGPADVNTVIREVVAAGADLLQQTGIMVNLEL